MPIKNFQAFTLRFDGRTNQLVTDIGISLPFNPQNQPNPIPPINTFKAIWDTGATNSCITENVISALGLQPIGKIPNHTANGVRESNQYLVNVYLPNKVAIPMVRVIDCHQLTGGVDILIGMDIIGIGDFSITHADNKTTMSYRVPSIKTIDYVVEASRLNEQHPNHSSKPHQQIRTERKKERQNKKKNKKKK